MELETTKADFFKFSNDLAQDNSKKSDKSKSAFKNLQGEYDQYSFILNIDDEVLGQQDFWLPIQLQNLLSCPHISPEQPPDLLNA